ncbi:MAG: hypothetical protein WC464_08795 [Bdellovibrionales bacterium]
MKNRDKTMLSVLALAELLLVSFPSGASAQSIYVQDVEKDDELNQNLSEIQFYINGNSRYLPGGVGVSDKYNTNYLLGGGKDGSPDWNTNSMISQVVYELGGPYSTAGALPFGKVTSTEGKGTQTQFFNTNTILHNAFLGSSASEEYIGKTYNVDTKQGALIQEPVMDKATGLGKSGTDVVSNATQAQKSATARFIDPPNSTQLGAVFRYRCQNKLNPVKAPDPEGRFIASAKTTSNLDCAEQNDTYVRRDRTLEALLGPLQYVAPEEMKPPETGAGETYVRFKNPVANEKYYPIYAAAGFCQNISLYAFSNAPSSANSTTAMQISNMMANQEALDSKLTANCWHFFEERVAYPKAVSETRNKAQAERCEEDYSVRHVIDKETKMTCQSEGRSTLKARFDMAYRMDSPEYVSYLNTLGAAVRAQLMAMALADAERFEQSLLMERQIMTGALTAANRTPIDLSGVSATTSISKSSGTGQ